MDKLQHNSELCNKDCMRCTHCCAIDYSFGKVRYELMLGRRREVFDKTVRKFPGDLIDYVAALAEEKLAAMDPPCVYLGYVDDNPGCMIHPTRFNGVDVRGKLKLTQAECLPKHGCYFPNYFRTVGERKLLEQFTSQAKDWYSYSRALRDCAVFNKTWSYIISRLPLNQISLDNVQTFVSDINHDLRQRFPTRVTNTSRKTSGIDLPLIFDEVFDSVFCTKNYMHFSPLFEQWGFEFGIPTKDSKHPNLEKRFKLRDFSSWGYFGDVEKPLYIYSPLGEILPVQFDDVAILNDRMLNQAIDVVNQRLA